MPCNKSTMSAPFYSGCLLAGYDLIGAFLGGPPVIHNFISEGSLEVKTSDNMER